MSVPNQKIISEFIYEPCDRDNHYLMMNLDALYAAMASLDKVYSIKLWLYLSKNARGYKNFELSQTDCASWGIPRSSYYKAVDDLIEKGYLVAVNGSGKLFTFYQIPVSTGDCQNSGESPLETAQSLLGTTESLLETEKSLLGTGQSPLGTEQSLLEQRKNTQNTQNTEEYRENTGKLQGEFLQSLLGTDEDEAFEEFLRQMNRR